MENFREMELHLRGVKMSVRLNQGQKANFIIIILYFFVEIFGPFPGGPTELTVSKLTSNLGSEFVVGIVKPVGLG